MKRPADIEKSRKEYLALPNIKWRKDYFDETTGGFVATHILKEKDNLHRTGIVAEVNACFELAKTGKHVLRLPENVPALINTISIMTDIQQINMIQNAIDREVGNRLRDNSWILLPDVFYLIDGKLSALWKKKKGR